MGTEGPNNELDALIERVSDTAQEVVKVALGLGILGINRVQALRHDLVAKLADDDQQ